MRLRSRRAVAPDALLSVVVPGYRGQVDSEYIAAENSISRIWTELSIASIMAAKHGDIAM